MGTVRLVALKRWRGERQQLVDPRRATENGETISDPRRGGAYLNIVCHPQLETARACDAGEGGGPGESAQGV